MSDQSAKPAPQKPKLSLNRETLRVLSGDLLDGVVGGLMLTGIDPPTMIGATCTPDPG